MMEVSLQQVEETVHAAVKSAMAAVVVRYLVMQIEVRDRKDRLTRSSNRGCLSSKSLAPYLSIRWP
jgi:hypothetical protein